jgi:hypothetical protein
MDKNNKKENQINEIKTLFSTKCSKILKSKKKKTFFI